MLGNPELTEVTIGPGGSVGIKVQSGVRVPQRIPTARPSPVSEATGAPRLLRNAVDYLGMEPKHFAKDS